MTSINTGITDSTTPATDPTATSAANKRYSKKGSRSSAAAPGQDDANDGPGFDMDAEPKVPEHLVAPNDPHAVRAPNRNAIHEALHHTAKLGLPASAPKQELLRASVQAAHRNAHFNGHATAFNADALGDASSDTAAAADANAASVQAQQRRNIYGSSPVSAAGVQDTLAERIYIQQVGLEDDGEKQAKTASQSKAAASAFRQGT